MDTGRIFNTYKSPFPALNVRRKNEAVAIDTVYSDTTSLIGGYCAAQFFVGIKTKVCDIVGLVNDGDLYHHWRITLG